MNSIIHFISRPFSSFHILLWLVLINFVTNAPDLIYHNSFFAIMAYISTSILFGYVESLLVLLVNHRWYKIAVLSFILVITSLLAVVDFFLILKFNRIVNEDVINIISETNIDESCQFLESYVNWIDIVIVLFSATVVNYLIYLTTQFIKNKNNRILLFIAKALTTCSFMFIFAIGYSVFFYGNAQGVTQSASLLRVAHGFNTMQNRKKAIKSLYSINDNLHLINDTTLEKRNIIVVIGESHSMFHSQLYGYEKETEPLLSSRSNTKELFILKDVISPFDATHDNMKAIFSFNSDQFNFMPLFPMIFNRLGYNVIMMDNQYLAGHTINFLSDENLSRRMFDYRNDKIYKYDLALVNNIPQPASPFLIIIHLMGQHFKYSERFPKEFQRFNPTDYTNFNLNQSKIIADYDNATLYNDFVLDSIINKFKDQNCAMVYFSDHGEEVYDYQNYFGHGTAQYAKRIDYQIRIPFIVWLSERFKESNPSVVNSLIKSSNKRISTRHFSHFVIDLAGIASSYTDFNPRKSFINEQYDSISPRYTMKSIKFD